MMRTVTTTLALALALATAAAPAMAANARHPYRNVDHRVDKGGDTGDSRVEQLNQAQLDNLRSQNGGTQQPGMMGSPMMQQTVPSSR